jgi:hypothetical protein
MNMPKDDQDDIDYIMKYGWREKLLKNHKQALKDMLEIHVLKKHVQKKKHNTT